MKTRIILIFAFAIVFFACNSEKDSLKFPDKSKIIGLASPVELNPENTVINLKDFFPETRSIDSVKADSHCKLVLSQDTVFVEISLVSENFPKLSTLDVYAEGTKYSILLKKSKKIKHTFIFDPKGKNYKSVAVKGEMNAWNPLNTLITFQNGKWTCDFWLEPGKYQYLMLLDGKEQTDTNNPQTADNNIGGTNSVMLVGTENTQKVPVLFTQTYTQNTVVFGSEQNCDSVFVFYDNYKIPVSEISENQFEIPIPVNAAKHDRTYLRVFAFNKGGLSNDLLIPLEKGKVLSEISQITRTDYEAAVLYNVFVDRFFNGDKNNDRPTPDKEILPKANYFGGDIAGIIAKVESGYFDSLGINTLWISPIVQNPETAFGKYPDPKTKFSAYHGYWPISLTKIDNRMGTEAEFKRLVDLAHSKNMNVLLDLVAHHVHEQCPIYKQHPDWTTDLHLPDGTLNTERWDDHRLTTWFDVFLPTLDLSKPEVYNMLSDSAVYWIEKYNLDGFRHDATKHIPEVFWRALTLKLKERIIIPQKRRLYQIGETYGTPELIKSYVGTGQLDGQFDFNTYDAAIAALAGNSDFINLNNTLQNSFNNYGFHNLMGNITGNQDRGRFISYASGALRFDEDAKKAGWKRNIEVKDPVGYKKSAILNAFLTTIPGVPVIYYGDEIGMPGGNDPDNRRMMLFSDLNPEQTDLKNITQKLIKFRKNSLPLIYGDFKLISAEKDILIYERNYFNKTVVIVLNISSEEKNLSFQIDKQFSGQKFNAFLGSSFNLKAENMNFVLNGNSFEIFSN